MQKAISSAFLLVACCAIPVDSARADLAVGLTHYWNFNDSGSTLDDSIGANDGTLQGAPTWTTGKFGGGLSFDGVDDQVALGLITASGNTLSIGGWVKFTSLPSAQPTAIESIFDSAQDAFVLYSDKANSEVRFKATDQDMPGDAARPGISQANLSPVAAGWVHVLGVYEGTSNRAAIYLNGQLNDTHTGADGTGNNLGNLLASQTAFFGSEGGGFFLHGALDDFAIWNRVLTLGEIAQLQTASVGQLTAVPESSPFYLFCGLALTAFGYQGCRAICRKNAPAA